MSRGGFVKFLPDDSVFYGGETQRVGAVMLVGSERYYMLLAKDGSVSMLPADVVEKEDAE